MCTSIQYVHIQTYVYNKCVYMYTCVCVYIDVVIVRTCKCSAQERCSHRRKPQTTHFMMPLGTAPRERVLEAVASWPQLSGIVRCDLCMVGSGVLWKFAKPRTTTC